MKYRPTRGRYSLKVPVSAITSPPHFMFLVEESLRNSGDSSFSWNWMGGQSIWDQHFESLSTSCLIRILYFIRSKQCEQHNEPATDKICQLTLWIWITNKQISTASTVEFKRRRQGVIIKLPTFWRINVWYSLPYYSYPTTFLKPSCFSPTRSSGWIFMTLKIWGPFIFFNHRTAKNYPISLIQVRKWFELDHHDQLEDVWMKNQVTKAKQTNIPDNIAINSFNFIGIHSFMK